VIAACGLICSDCSIFKAATNKEFAERLAEQWRNAGHKDAEPSWFKCRGCSSDDSHVWSPDCPIRKCCLKVKRWDNCSLCEEFPCDLIIKFENDPYPHHKEAVANLRRMKGE